MSALQKQLVDPMNSLAGVCGDTSFSADQSASAKNFEQSKKLFTLVDNALEERLWDNRSELKIITSTYSASHLDSDIKAQLFSQIDWLLNSEEWEEGDNFADTESFKTLIKFILNSNPSRAPYLGLSDSGHLLASWVSESNKLILECLPRDCIKWFVSCVFDGKKERVGGEAPSLERLLAVLTPFIKNAGWFKL
ncbi:MAG: hypothetical protein V1721_07660 [Pseudomonadota bacterium]